MISVLFAREDSVYKSIRGCDVWDIKRDATRYRGSNPVIAHPPCRAWGSLRFMAKPLPGERELAFFAVDQVRRCGGVLEHPIRSVLWPAAGLPEPGERDKFGGWTLPVPQFWWGHMADKATHLYIVGIEPAQLPAILLRLGTAPRVVASKKRVRDGGRSEITKADRDRTPVDFAIWLCDVARFCGKQMALRRAA